MLLSLDLLYFFVMVTDNEVGNELLFSLGLQVIEKNAVPNWTSLKFSLRCFLLLERICVYIAPTHHYKLKAGEM